MFGLGKLGQGVWVGTGNMVFCSKDVKILYHGDHNVEPFSMLYSTYL